MVKVLIIIGIRKLFRDIVTEMINAYRVGRRFFRLEVCRFGDVVVSLPKDLLICGPGTWS